MLKKYSVNRYLIFLIVSHIIKLMSVNDFLMSVGHQRKVNFIFTVYQYEVRNYNRNYYLHKIKYFNSFYLFYFVLYSYYFI